MVERRRGDRITLLGNEADLWVCAYKAQPKEVAVIAINRGGAVSRTIGAGALGLASSGLSGWTAALGTDSATTAGSELAITLGAGEAAIFVASSPRGFRQRGPTSRAARSTALRARRARPAHCACGRHLRTRVSCI